MADTGTLIEEDVFALGHDQSDIKQHMISHLEKEGIALNVLHRGQWKPLSLCQTTVVLFRAGKCKDPVISIYS